MFVSTTGETIRELHRAGVGNPEIARRLGVAVTTVSYHVGRLPRAAADTEPHPAATEVPVSQIRTRTEVKRLLDAGVERAAIARRLGISKGTVSYHARRLGATIDERCARRYDWSAIQRHYDEGHSVRDCIAAFGFSSASWAEAVRRGAITPRPAGLPMADLLVAGTYRGRFNLKLRLIREGLKENRCERCGLAEWCGQPLTVALHHINGDRHDNRLENLEFLCPNCHAQTDNFAGRNGRGRVGARAPGSSARGSTESGQVDPNADGA